MANINPITSLYFDKTFFKEVEKYLKNKVPYTHCIMAIDIEHFHLYNAIYGEAKADQMLIEIADILRQYEIEYDGVAGYLGADNFAIVMEYNKENLRKLQKEIRSRIRIINKSTGYPPAFGVYTIMDVTEPAVVMYNHAIVALSYVIGNYTTRYAEYYPDMDGKQEDEIRLLKEVQEGIENDEFTFYIQPQYDISKQKIVGGESLVRWNSKKRGLVSPMEFVPVLEKNGFIADLDQIVWEKVCQWLRSCIDKGYQPVPLSINVSRIDIFSLDVPEFLVSLINKYDIPIGLLKVEITESAYAEESEVIIKTANQLKDYGFLVMMDDFGSGYSSLNMLKSMPVDVIKMDMRFLEINEYEDEKGIGIIESVVNMARQMRIPIVVEGVETKAQENLLRKVGCSYTQGFFYYRPMPLHDFEELISDSQNLDHSGFWYRQAESVHLREFLDDNLFSDTIINNILGPAVFYDMYENHIEITRVNEQYFQLAKITNDEGDAYRDRFWNSVRDDDRQLLYSIFTQAYENPEEGASGYIHFLRRDGKTLWINIKVFLLRTKEGHKLFYASLTDMTDVKIEEAEVEALKQSDEELTAELLNVMDTYYGSLPCGVLVGKISFDEPEQTIRYIINYVNPIIAKMSGGDMERLRLLIEALMEGKREDFLEKAYSAAYKGESFQLHVYSSVSNRYFEINMSQYQHGYVCVTLLDGTRARIYEGVSNNIMTTFREVYFLQLQDNYCRKIYPEDDDLLDRGNYEEMINRHFESGKILSDDEANVRQFLSLQFMKKELQTKDSIEYRYKRAIESLGSEWCYVVVNVSERQEDGQPKTATLTIRSIEVLMREKENNKRQNMAITLAGMSDGFFVYNAKKEEKIVFANPSVLHMFGCKNMDTFLTHINGNFQGLVHPDDYNRIEWEIANQQKSSEKNLDFIHYRIIRKDGQVRWVEDVGYLEAAVGEDVPEMFYVFVWDVTDKMADEQKEKLIKESAHFNKANN